MYNIFVSEIQQQMRKGNEMKEIKGKDKVFFGVRKSDNVGVFITKPQWACDWYWAMGYLGNKNEHYHLENYDNGRNTNMYDALKEDYVLSEKIEKNLWVFCELMTTAYTLKKVAEVYHLGGSHYTENPVIDLLKNPDENKRLNEVVLPALFEKVQNIVEKGVVE